MLQAVSKSYWCIMANSSPPLDRSPLTTRTNSPPPRTPSPAFTTAKSTQPRQLRRQVSFRTFHPNADSSETDPSEHSSIFEALYLPPGFEKFPDLNVARASGGRSSSSSDGNGNAPMLERTASPITAARNMWIGTQLDTITEQKSIATLRASNSLSRMGSRDDNLKPAQKLSAASLRVQAGHKQSFSLDDLPLRRKEQIKSSDETNASLPHIQGDYTHPNEPIQDPPHRMPTPPGLPSFGTREAHNYRIETPFRLRDFFSRSTSTTQTDGLPRGIVARGPDGAVVRGRWRATQSGYNGSVGSTALTVHPFHNAPIAKTVQETNAQPEMREARSERSERHVRFTTSAMGGEDEAPTAGPTSTELYHCALRSEPVPETPAARESSTPRVTTSTSGQARTWQEVANKSKWEEFCEFMCFLCCGVEGQGSREMAAPILPYGTSRPTPRYASSLYGR